MTTEPNTVYWRHTALKSVIGFGLFVMSPVSQAQPLPSPHPVCIQAHTPAAGLNPTELLTTIRLEGRKVGIESWQVEQGTTETCPGSSVPCIRVLITNEETHVITPTSAEEISFLDIQPLDRPQRLAELVVLAATETRGGPLQVLTDADRSDPFSMRPTVMFTEAPTLPQAEPPALQFNAIVGGRYTYPIGPDVHLGSIEAGVEAVLFSGYLTTRLLGSWTPPHSVRTAPNATWSGADVGLSLFAGIPWGRFLFRAGLTAGWEWRFLAVDTEHRFDDPQTSSSVPWIGGELEAVVQLYSPWWLALAIGGRGYPTGVELQWAEQPWLNSTDGSITFTLRTGVTFL